MRLERELMRGAGPVAVLRLLFVRPMYGYELVDTLASRTEGVLAMGQSTLYPLLYNLEAKGLIQAEWREGEAARPRKYYSLTGAGKRRLETDSKQWAALAQVMTALGVIGPEAAGVGA
ncbi:MAG: PadR family transcriptional regulator [Leptolyngbya sp. PLA2]|nr:PadR family transcriptional regulator [Leptolyngbya sp.]MCE7971142.1 PadR family transcriptional regulator [Leptolyngbya sp. PL-A2]MCQ3940821.1 PadR family transcriptional regulator [cyanobacterium CYA1]MCZ7634157.1 helix-turn-helix transcriptional regulator [Phycisphaerales bacterium]MDL1905136.1 PadR family transcriptional regulator [Synechococcales cyanobacterium CNB]GIK19315.1 MAG: putative DNA-binding protein YwzG [Planctomycetota bacterium]